jgi:hypothetical protein
MQKVKQAKYTHPLEAHRPKGKKNTAMVWDIRYMLSNTSSQRYTIMGKKNGSVVVL